MAVTLKATLFTLVVLLVFEFVLASRLQGIALNTDPLREHDELILQDSVVKFINQNAEAGWKASMNPRFANHTISEFKRLLGVKPLPEGNSIVAPVVSHKRVMNLPENFDARQAWPQCSTISRILDQGHCGSCWAFGAVESLSDRFCIRFGQNLSLSANDLLACCDSCGDGCDGGYPILAWQYFVETGVVTEQCDPYFDTQGCSHPGCEPEYPTPTCPNKCSAQNLLWANSKHFSVNAYRIRSDPYSIMAEIFTNGPVEVSFTVYQDFAHYTSGVYRHILGGEIGGHAVKLIGWGTTDAGEDYWLLANQWNRSWGEDGYFKIVRGVNECGIEEDVVAGLPSARNMWPELQTS